MTTLLRRAILDFISDKAGSTATEYALVATVVAISAIGGLIALGTSSDGLWQDTGDQLVGAFQSR